MVPPAATAKHVTVPGLNSRLYVDVPGVVDLGSASSSWWRHGMKSCAAACASAFDMVFLVGSSGIGESVAVSYLSGQAVIVTCCGPAVSCTGTKGSRRTGPYHPGLRAHCAISCLCVEVVSDVTVGEYWSGCYYDIVAPRRGSP